MTTYLKTFFKIFILNLKKGLVKDIPEVGQMKLKNYSGLSYVEDQKIIGIKKVFLGTCCYEKKKKKF
jgi:hypothetical protein